MAARRWHARRILKRSGDVWPILESAGRKPDGWPGWPDGKQFALVLTHDVEGPRGLANVKRLAELEMSLGFRSSFNFIPEGSYRVPPELREWLVDNGFEVGVHDLYHDGRLYWNQEHFRRCAEKINRYLNEWNAVGFRGGFMHSNLDWIHELDILYDSSTFDTDPFEPQPEGVGTIFPFWVARAVSEGTGYAGKGIREAQQCQRSILGSQERDSSSALHETSNGQCSLYPSSLSRSSGYVELPYTLPQDSTLFLLLRQESMAIWKRKLNWVAEHGGLALILTHPDYMNFGSSRVSGLSYRASYYAQFVRHVASHYAGKCWYALPATIARLIT